MRVLSIGFMYPPHDLGGGYELTWRSAVRSMRERGDTVRVLASDWRRPEPAPDGELDDDDVHRELRVYWRDHAFPRLGPGARLAIERHNAAALDRHLAELRPQVVNWWAMGGMSLSLVERVRRASLPAVGVVGDDWLSWGPRADGWIRPFRSRPRAARAVERLTGLPARVDLRAGALWLFNSEAMKASSLAVHGDLEHVGVAHPGIDEGRFKRAEDRPWRWRLLYLGRMDPRKGVHLAVDALAELPDEATLVLQGGGEDDYVRELRERIARLGLERRVSFSNEPRDRLAAVYADADAVLFPVQWDEPWGLVPLEAMAVGRPVIATGTGGSGEYLRDERNCLIYRPRHSATALAAAIRRLASEAELRERIRAQGARTAARFTESAYNEAIRSALAQAAAWRGRSPGRRRPGPKRRPCGRPGPGRPELARPEPRRPKPARPEPIVTTALSDPPATRYHASRPTDLRSAPPWHRLAYIIRALPAGIEELAAELRVPPGGTVLDFGCAELPYRRLFAADADYLAADLPGNPQASVPIRPDGTVPVADESCDAVLSTQALEHVADPDLYLSECFRVLRPGGRLLLSTHGVMAYHPDPVDYWRWTCAGLERIVAASGFELVRFEGIMGLAASGLQLAQDGIYYRLPRLVRPLVALAAQGLIAVVERLQAAEGRRLNALVFVLVAERP